MPVGVPPGKMPFPWKVTGRLSPAKWATTRKLVLVITSTSLILDPTLDIRPTTPAWEMTPRPGTICARFPFLKPMLCHQLEKVRRDTLAMIGLNEALESSPRESSRLPISLCKRRSRSSSFWRISMFAICRE